MTFFFTFFTSTFTTLFSIGYLCCLRLTLGWKNIRCKLKRVKKYKTGRIELQSLTGNSATDLLSSQTAVNGFPFVAHISSDTFLSIFSASYFSILLWYLLVVIGRQIIGCSADCFSSFLFCVSLCLALRHFSNNLSALPFMSASITLCPWLDMHAKNYLICRLKNKIKIALKFKYAENVWPLCRLLLLLLLLLLKL